jgi:hypothetical protein
MASRARMASRLTLLALIRFLRITPTSSMGDNYLCVSRHAKSWGCNERIDADEDPESDSRTLDGAYRLCGMPRLGEATESSTLLWS